MLVPVSKFVNGDVIDSYDSITLIEDSGMNDASMLSIAVYDLAIGEDVKPLDSQMEQVRAELNRVLNSAHFDASERNRRFLGYVVEETLMGRGERIKAYTIATIVFGRDDSFDPTLDPVVRMEARRLRRSLERFYLFEGEEGPIRIALPKGGYVPQFQPAGTERPDGKPIRADDSRFLFRGPSIFVSVFELEYSHHRDVNFCDGLARQIVIALSRFSELTVFMSRPNIELQLQAGPAPCASEVDFFLAGNVAAGADVLKVKTTLLDARTGRVVRAETYAGDMQGNDLLDERDRIADDIARQLSVCFTASQEAACS